MLNRLITFALQQRVFVLALAVAVVIGGWYAWQNLPIEAFPDVQDVQVQVITQMPGQAPEEVERSVTLPIERALGGVPHMTQMRSVSITGLSVVTLAFSDKTDDYFARQQVTERLGDADLPPNVQPSLAPMSSAVGEIYRYVLDAPADMPLSEVRAIQDWVIAPALKRTQGVADVQSFGGIVKEYQVLINPMLLRKYGLTIDQISQALTASSENVGGGLLRRGDESLVVRGIGLFNSLDDIRHVIVSANNGRTVQVSDVARVEVGGRPRSGIVAFNDRDDVVEGVVDLTRGQNAAKVIAALKEQIAQVSAKLPPGVKIVPFYDRTDLLHHTVHTVAENLATGAVLVVAILVIFLRNWYAAFAVATVIPLALLFAFILMDERGVNANLISLGSVDFGIIIDSAVVLVEALMVRLAIGTAAGATEKSLPRDYRWRMNTLRHTAVDLGSPILFSKAIIILAFLPIFTFQHVEGKIFSPMAYTLSFALLGAILLTLFLVPALLSFAMRKVDLAEKHSPWMYNLQQRYRALLLEMQSHRVMVVSVSVGLLVLALALGSQLGSEFLPKLDEGNIWLTVSLPPSSSLEHTKEIERNVRTILRSYPEVGDVVTQVGRPDDGTDPKGPNNLEILADLKPHDTWRFPNKDALIADMTKHMAAMPGVPTNFSQVIEDNMEEALSGVKGEIAIKIFGQDLQILEDKSQEVANVLNSVPGATDVGTIPIGGQTELDITLDRAKLARYGIDVASVNDTIATTLGGKAVNVFYEGDRRYDVVVRIDEPFRDAVDDVADLPIALPASSNGGSGTIPLGEVANVEVKQGAARISREAGGRNIAIKCNLMGRDQGSFVAQAMHDVAAQVKLPPGYYMTWGGQFENQQRAVARLKVIVPLSAFLIFVLLFWAFRSVPQALLVLCMVPFTLIGGLTGLALAGLHLSVSAAVGFIAVAGISVQNGVIMVEQFAAIIRSGKTLAEAAIEGAVMRLRPILMTALMAGLGLLPAALSHGIGSETQRPFAVVIVGGVVSATIFTLILLPLMFPVMVQNRPWKPADEAADDESTN